MSLFLFQQPPAHTCTTSCCLCELFSNPDYIAQQKGCQSRTESAIQWEWLCNKRISKWMFERAAALA